MVPLQDLAFLFVAEFVVEFNELEVVPVDRDFRRQAEPVPAHSFELVRLSSYKFLPFLLIHFVSLVDFLGPFAVGVCERGLQKNYHVIKEDLE